MKLNYLFLFVILSINPSFGQSNKILKEKITKLLTEQNLSGAIWCTVSEKGEITSDVYGYKKTTTKDLLLID